ncbi:MAG TPA: hypothetical protein VKV18_05635 [Chthonomonas sp.]|uniref:hypothetical protein n=1 Tax=Chthonomonas sp. TaxID=2282153 RepID=UPI002B4B738D|nr:hypothetical protein [Chthonomonas sp.]HLI48158.1 hypothetical protein [Chthonomonas sp.]
MPDAAMPLRCHCRHHEITSLRCARCGVPICPHCSVVYPAGMLCKQCAKPSRAARLQLQPQEFILALVAGTTVSYVAAWLLLLAEGLLISVHLGFLAIFLAFFHGMLVGETVRRVTRYKRGDQVEKLAWLAAALGLIGMVLYLSGGHLAALLNLMLWLRIALSIVGAHNRVRAY